MDKGIALKDGITLPLIIDHFAYLLDKMTEFSPHSASELMIDETLNYYHSGSTDQLLNGIFLNHLDSGNLDERVLNLLARFEAKNSPYTLWLPEAELTPALQKIFDAKGLQTGSTLICIGSRLDEINQIPAMDRLEVMPVVTEQQYDLYMDILSFGFQLNGPVTHDFKNMLASYGQSNSIYKHYIAYLDGEAASVITTLAYQDILGMYCGTTLPQYQNMGICTELYRYTMNEAIEAGCTRCVYQSANHAVVNFISKKFGFKEYGRLIRYTKRNSL